MANKVRLGIIGLGAQGSMYAGFIATAWCQTSRSAPSAMWTRQRLRSSESKYSGVPFYDDYVAMLEAVT